jgi:PAS domain S-box-containing protein/putative nucleotidyltransferase with HDIG domain
MARESLFNEIIRALSLTLDFDESQKYYHAWRVAILSAYVAEELDIPEKNLIYYAGLLHDIGAIGLRDHVIHHAANDFKQVEARSHAALGAKILRPFTLFKPLGPIIENHHEHYDGSGFPAGKKGDEIPICASIIQLADVLDVKCRNLPPDQVTEIATGIVKVFSGKLFPESVAEGALSFIESNSKLVTDIFNNDLLGDIVKDYSPQLPDLQEISDIRLLIQLLWVFAEIIDTKHTYTLGHSTRVAFYAYKISKTLGEGTINSWDVLWAGLLHDVGKVGTPREILDKESGLTEQEWLVMKKHAQDSMEIISSISDLAYLAYPAAAHHEFYNGKGYPLGKAGENIPLIGRILAYADAYDALTSPRAYRKGLSHRTALDIIERGIGSHWDPHLADVAMKTFDEFGVESANPPPSRDEFMRFFDEVSEDIDRLAGSGKQADSSDTPGSRKILLQDTAPWYTISVNRDFTITRGKKNLILVFGETDTDNFLDLLDEGSAQTIKSVVGNLAEMESTSRFVSAKNGETIELILSDRSDGGDIIFRNASQQINPMQRMSLFYRNFMTSSEAVLFTNQEGHVLDANDRFSEIFGFSIAEVAGRMLKFLASPNQSSDTFRRMHADILDSKKGTWSGELLTINKAGEDIPVSMTIKSIREANGLIIGYIVSALDISERKRLQNAVKEMALFAELNPSPVLRLDADGTIILSNQAAKNLFLDPNLEGKPWSSICHDEGRPDCNSFLLDRTSHQHEAEMGDRVILFTYEKLPETGKIDIYGTDITPRKRAEKELVKKNQELERLNRLKSDLVAITSHDLKSPLNAMISYADLLKETYHNLSEEKIGRYLENIRGSGQKLVGFISEILNIEKIESGEFKLDTSRVHLDDILKSSVEINRISAKTRDIEITFSVDGTPKPIITDAIKIEQVFNNLISNAIKFSEPKTAINVEYSFKGDSIVIDVCDRGPGIPPEDIDSIFNRYYQVNKKGSAAKRAFGAGLGLYIVKTIVELHGGKVFAKNRTAGGCCFTIEIPANGLIASDKHLAVLVIDPKRIIRKYLEEPLRRKEVFLSIADDITDAELLYQQERHDIIFVYEPSPAEEIMQFIKKTETGDTIIPAVINLSDNEPTKDDKIFYKTMVTPVLDIEIFEILQEVRSKMVSNKESV